MSLGSEVTIRPPPVGKHNAMRCASTRSSVPEPDSLRTAPTIRARRNVVSTTRIPERRPFAASWRANNDSTARVRSRPRHTSAQTTAGVSTSRSISHISVTSDQRRDLRPALMGPDNSVKAAESRMSGWLTRHGTSRHYDQVRRQVRQLPRTPTLDLPPRLARKV